MNKNLPFLFLLCLVCQQISTASALSIGLPLPNTIVFAGAGTLVTWMGVPKTAKGINVFLATGQSETALTTIATFGNNLPADKSSLWVSVPKDTPSGTNYYIVVQGNDTPPSQATVPVHVVFGTSPSTTSAAGNSTGNSTGSSTGNATTIAPTPPPSSTPVTSNTTSIVTSSSANSTRTVLTSATTAQKPTDPPSPSPAPITTAATTTTTAVAQDDEGSQGTLSSQGLTGAVVGSVVGAFALASAVLFWLRRRRPSQKEQDNYHQNDMFADPSDTKTYRRGLGAEPVAPPASYGYAFNQSQPPYDHSQASYDHSQTPYEYTSYPESWNTASVVPMQQQNAWPMMATMSSNTSTTTPAADKPHAKQ